MQTMEDAIKQSLGDRLLKLHKQTLTWNLTQAPRAAVVPSHPGLVFNSKQSRVNRVYWKLYNVLPRITVHSHVAMQWRHWTIMNNGTRYSVHWLWSSITGAKWQNSPIYCHESLLTFLLLLFMVRILSLGPDIGESSYFWMRFFQLSSPFFCNADSLHEKYKMNKDLVNKCDACISGTNW